MDGFGVQNQNPVLVTDSLLRKSLAVVRSLGSKGIPVYTAEHTRFSLAGCSRYAKGVFTYPDPKQDPDGFIHQLIQILHTIQTRHPGRTPFLFAMDDRTLELVIQHKDQLQSNCNMLIPNPDAYQIASDKLKTIQLADALGIPHPVTICPSDVQDLEYVCKTLRYPILLKPRWSSGSRGIRVIQDENELYTQYPSLCKDYHAPMLQELIPTGPRYDVCLLFDHSQDVKASFTQREIRHFPVPMGPSTAQESVRMPELEQYAIQLGKKLKWQGIFEVEFMLDTRTGEPKLMEINPRYWNSLALSIQTGVDFPYLHYRLLQEERFMPVTNYEVGRICRNLLPGDILHFLSFSKRGRMEPPLFRRKRTTEKRNRIQDDILSIQDPLPTIGFIASCFRYLFDRNMWNMLLKR